MGSRRGSVGSSASVWLGNGVVSRFRWEGWAWRVAQLVTLEQTLKEEAAAYGQSGLVVRGCAANEVSGSHAMLPFWVCSTIACFLAMLHRHAPSSGVSI